MLFCGVGQKYTRRRIACPAASSVPFRLELKLIRPLLLRTGVRAYVGVAEVGVGGDPEALVASCLITGASDKPTGCPVGVGKFWPAIGGHGGGNTRPELLGGRRGMGPVLFNCPFPLGTTRLQASWPVGVRLFGVSEGALLV